MKALAKSARIATLVVILGLVFALTSCSIFGGTMKLESFSVNPSTVKTEYNIGDEIDFSGIEILVKYSDESLNTTLKFADIKLEYPANITETAGKKEIKVVYDDPNLKVTHSATVKITVKDPNAGGGTVELPIVTGFEKPSSILVFENDKKTAGTLNYGDQGFSGQFIDGNKVYTVGYANAFSFKPSFSVLDGTTVLTPEEFYTVVDINYTPSDAETVNTVVKTVSESDANVSEYRLGDTLIATVDTFRGIYSFTEAASNMPLTITVRPSSDHYVTDDINPINLEITVVNAYNVYEAWQLAVIDNYAGRDVWDTFKTEHGISDVYPAGIVLHGDIHITSADVPASFFYETTEDVIYKNSISGDEVKVPAGTKYLKDSEQIYRRQGGDDFAIYGNYFTLDLSGFPLVASPAVFGSAYPDRHYGTDFSNTALFLFETRSDRGDKPEDVAIINIEGLALIGNAGRNNLIDAESNLVSAGGLIFMKVSRHTELAVNNSIGNSFFITYLPEGQSTLTLEKVKAYDSYQNAMLIWSDAVVTVKDSFFNGAGGPLVIAESVLDENNWYHPTFNAENSKFNTSLSGDEIWFTAFNAEPIVGQIQGLGAGLTQAGLGSITDSNGMMNIMGLLMKDGTSATEIVGGIDAQGLMMYNGKGIDRTKTGTSYWDMIYQISLGAYQQSGQLPPFFTVYDAQGTAYSIYYNGTTFVTLEGAALNSADANQMPLLAAFMAADTITLSQGGISVIFEFIH